MDKTHGLAVCDLCQEPPVLGWLYVCQQDHAQDRLLSENITPDFEETDTPNIRELKELGFSRSILRQAEEGRYSADQLDFLKKQKYCVNKVVENQLAISGATLEEEESSEISFHPNITLRKKSPFSSKQWPASRRGPTTYANARCNLKCCHVGLSVDFNITLT